MDNLSENQNKLSEPTVIVKKSFLQTKKGLSFLAIILALIIFGVLMITLNYFGVISPSQLTFLPKGSFSTTGTPVKLSLIPENYGFKAGELTLSCPVESVFCPSQKLVNIDKKDTLIYKAASGSGVLNLAEVPSLENIAVLTNIQTQKKYFYESVVSSDGKSCYTIAYTLPIDATFGDLLSIPGRADAKIATLGSQKILINGAESSVIIQVRNTPMDPGVPCSLIKKSPEFFKSF